MVEDSDMVRKITIRRLSSSGYAVREAASGDEALAMLQRDIGFDLVLSDSVIAGGVSGFDVARWVRDRMPNCRVLLTSGFSDSAPEREADLDLPPVLGKPYTSAELLGAVYAVLTGEPINI